MGIFEKASKSLSRASEETVRVMDADDAPEEFEAEPKAPKPPKAKREKKRINFGAAKVFNRAEEDDEDYEEPEEEFEFNSSIEEEPKFSFDDDTAFAIDDSEPNFYEEKQKQWERQKGAVAEVEELIPTDGQVQDVLDMLQIPSTFVLRDTMLMPEDFEGFEFDLQVPQGYDIGQVDFFVGKTADTIKELLSLLELRNKHIMQLATTVDRIQVDLNNIRYETQIEAAIGVIPTSESADLEKDNMELKLEIQRLKDQMKTGINSNERKLYEEMRNELSKKEREIEQLKEKNYDLTNAYAELEESLDTMSAAPAKDDTGGILHEDGGDNEASSVVLPDFSDLPELPVASPKPNFIKDTSFAIDDEDDFFDSSTDGVFTPAVEEPSNSIFIATDDDDDDELDKLMRDWKN